MGWGLWTSDTLRAFILVGDFQSDSSDSTSIGEELAVSSAQPEDGDLLGSVQLVDMVFFHRFHLQTLPSCDLELASQEGFGFSVRYGEVVHSLYQPAA